MAATIIVYYHSIAAGPPYDEESRTYIQVRPEWPAVHDVPQAIAAASNKLQQPTPGNQLLPKAGGLLEICTAAHTAAIRSSQ
jgi:hypothetical protein